jgi:AcrR family transcriptional regulator
VPDPPVVTRRERLRAQALGEIKHHALAQVVEGGPEALSLSAIARSMGMSGPALYRYFASREDLLAALVADSYDDLADTLQAAAAHARRRAPAARLRALATAYRGWALAHPHRYRLVFSSTYGSGHLAPERTVPAAHRSMSLFLDAIADLGPHDDPGSERGTALDRQLERWARSRSDGAELPAAVLHLGVVAWTRLHGVVSLEIEGTFASMELDGERLYEAEVDQLIAQRSGR